MNFKKMVITGLAALSFFSVAGMASAGMDSDVNIYGASAQYILWNTIADDYMVSLNCSNPAFAQAGKLESGVWKANGKYAITRATCDTTGGGSETRYFRVASKASYAGVLAAQGNTTSPYRPNECTDPHQVLMIDETACDFSSGHCTETYKCVTVTGGASDVPVECFKQSSHGQLKGPLGGGEITRNFLTDPMSWTGDTPCKPMVVPFAFFVHNDVGTTNITRDHAELIYSGQIYFWSDLADSSGTPFSATPVNVCLRHAGSGTHASLDAYLTSPLIVDEYVEAGGTNFYFNDGSSDMMKCVNGSGSWSGAGAIGYADADQSLSSYANTVRTTLNGVTVSKNAIKYGNYNFYGLQQLYGVAESDPLCTFAKGNVNHDPWVSAAAMKYKRVQACEAFPLQWVQ
jgi:hypothetical protein